MDYRTRIFLILWSSIKLSIVAESIRNTVNSFWKLCKLELRSWEQIDCCAGRGVSDSSVVVRGHRAGGPLSLPGYYGCGLTHGVQ
jgi:hypothetical protein